MLDPPNKVQHNPGIIIITRWCLLLSDDKLGAPYHCVFAVVAHREYFYLGNVLSENSN